MKVLVRGKGGRESAIVRSLLRNPDVLVHCAPGNPGIAQVTTCHSNIVTLAQFCDLAKHLRPDLVVPGPEVDLQDGLVDQMAKLGFRTAGPDTNEDEHGMSAVKLETSKVDCAQVCEEAGVPMPDRSVLYEHSESAVEDACTQLGLPIVVKLDELAAGKGVVIAQTLAEAQAAVVDMMVLRKFGPKTGHRVLFQEFVEGEELTVNAATDGEDVQVIGYARDHKRRFDDDQGPNTGGMGAYSGGWMVSSEQEKFILNSILKPVIHRLRERGLRYRGVIYAGLMIKKNGDIVVLEFNIRFGDPEAQCILPLLKTDLAELLLATTQDGVLGKMRVQRSKKTAVTVVGCHKYYPEASSSGVLITGLDMAQGLDEGVLVDLAGATYGAQGKIFTDGGRIVGVTGVGDDFGEAIDLAYQGIDLIRFERMDYRRDIGRRTYEALMRSAGRC